MALDDEIYTLLSGRAAITAIVGNRIYPVTMPEDFTYSGPFIVVTRISNKSQECLAGSAGIARARYQFSCYAQARDGGRKTCRAIAEQLRLLLQPYRGGSIWDCSHAGDADLYEPSVLLFHVPADWMIQFSEPIPS